MSDTAPSADLLAALGALGRSMQDRFDPRRFLGPFSARIQDLVPHDRLVIDYLEDDGRTFTVFAEAATPEMTMHERHYTTDFDPRARYVVAEWSIGPVFAGTTLRVDDAGTDPRTRVANVYELRVWEAGIRSLLAVPLPGQDRIIGAVIATSLQLARYTEEHAARARELAAMISPFIQNVVLLERERRRRRRLVALDELPHALAGSLNVRNVFDRLAAATRQALDFDLMGAALLSGDRREVEILAEFDERPGAPTPPRMPIDHFSFGRRVVAGEPILIHDAAVELDPSRPGDRLIIDDGGCSVLAVPLRFGDEVGGAFYVGKREANWFDRADVEIARGIAAQVVLAVQHQRLGEEQRRLAGLELRARQLEQRLDSLRESLDERYGFDRLIGQAPAFREALRLATKVAPTETTVLLTGESGTGKELVARAIHHASARSDGPFVAVNCAALPETLLESELFGHERGAFTGADRQKPGRFELASGGTLFLDEVGELSAPVQAKLLRVLQEHEFERVGGTRTLRADARIIAATNRDLARAVAEGRFREDLYYRLNVFALHLPPLRQRSEDVLLLADHFVRTLGAKMGKGEPGISRDAREALVGHAWPGNIRELQNAVERALILSDGDLLTATHLGLPVPATAPRGAPAAGAAPAPPSVRAPLTPPAPPGEPHSLPEWERHMVVEAVRKAEGNKSRAARILGLTRSQLYTRLKRFGLED
jgi:transcriptional regulator with GAF, ATPase, and Fis domain